MEDEEYPAYLKQQTIDDLVHISNSIDQQTQPKRYAMVLAELAEREKQGERPTPPWRRNRKYNRVKSFIGALILSGIAAASIYTGRTSLRKNPVIRREDPSLFWTLLSLEILGALFLFYGAFGDRKR